MLNEMGKSLNFEILIISDLVLTRENQNVVAIYCNVLLQEEKASMELVIFQSQFLETEV